MSILGEPHHRSHLVHQQCHRQGPCKTAKDGSSDIRFHFQTSLLRYSNHVIGAQRKKIQAGTIQNSPYSLNLFPHGASLIVRR